jgi:CheY-like chemotaxis protein
MSVTKARQPPKEEVMAPRILLVDDDMVFAKHLAREAKRQGAEVDWYPSFAQLGRVGRLGDYDCVVADLSSDPVTGIEIAQYATAFFSDLPVLLVSDDAPAGSPSGRLPSEIHAQIPKTAGAAAVMRTAIDMCVTSEPRQCPPMPRARATTYRLSA